jgi:alkylation response protein AidB-like acyl-CoA dehydrogenase
MLESMVYRTGGLIEGILATLDPAAEDIGRQTAKSISEYAVECSINKVFGSEVEGYVADETVQIYGGYGYIEEYPAERIYRDSRITRIFEGTNEINRVIITGWLMRKALKNELPLFTEAENIKAKLPTMKPLSPGAKDGPLGYQRKLVERAKKIFVFLAGAAAQKYGMAIEEQQEVLGLLADIAQEIYAMESGLLRALKSVDAVGENQSKTKIDMVRLYVNDAVMRISNNAQLVISAMEGGETLDSQLAMLRKALQFTTINTVQARRDIADRIIEAEKFAC